MGRRLRLTDEQRRRLAVKGKRLEITGRGRVHCDAGHDLQGKPPRELQPLWVTVLGHDETALRNMENAVLGINEKNTQWQPCSKTSSTLWRGSAPV